MTEETKPTVAVPRKNTVQEIVKDIVEHLSEEDIQFLKEHTKREIQALHHSFGMFVRNHYELWNKEHPLTSSWFADCEAKTNAHIIDGLDCHPCHPDAVSDQVLQALHDEVIKS